MTAAEKRVKNRDRNKRFWMFYKNGLIDFPEVKCLDLLFNFSLSGKRSVYFKHTKWVNELNKNERNNNKRLITYLNRKARAEHMKRHGKTPKPVKTIRQMYLDEKKIN